MSSSSLLISALLAIRERIDGAERIFKADIARIKKLLANLHVTFEPGSGPRGTSSHNARSVNDRSHASESKGNSRAAGG
jgi:hypothetical protein